MLLDSPIVRAHVSAAGAPKKKEADPALGRNRGGFGTKIHILADRRGRPLHLRVTGGPRHDRIQARALGEDGTDAPLSCLIADRAYDSDDFRAWLAQRDIEAVIPARRGHLNPQSHAPERYKARNAVERASAGSNKGAAWPPTTTNTRSGSWVSCTWRQLGSGCNPKPTRPNV